MMSMAPTPLSGKPAIATIASRLPPIWSSKNIIGDSFRGATRVSIHNSGGVGWGEVINGGFGMLLVGTAEVDRRLQSMLFYDVNNEISRRAWARNTEAVFAIKREMERTPGLKVTVPEIVDEGVLGFWKKQ